MAFCSRSDAATLTLAALSWVGVSMKRLRRFALLGLSLSIAAGAVHAVEDPGALGPHLVTQVDYGSYAHEFQTLSLPGPTEVLASVHYPDPLPMTPSPIVVLLHGAHTTCHDGVDGIIEWPCPASYPNPIPSYIGYDYLGKVLASHGYIVVSISNNAGIFIIQAGAEIIQHHLELWKDWNDGAPAPSIPDPGNFAGKVDLDRVGTLGHSRGGEGVIRHVLWNEAQQNSPFNVRAMMALAPQDITNVTDPNSPFLAPGEDPVVLRDVPLAFVLPYCDGDQKTLGGIHSFDNTRYYPEPGNTATRHSILAMGANHNFFNTIWSPLSSVPGGSDDALDVGATPYDEDPICGTPESFALGQRFTEEEQQAFITTYSVAFFRRYLGDEIQFESILTGHTPPPPSALVDTDDLVFSFHAPEALRLDVNRLLDEEVNPFALNEFGQTPTESGFFSSAVELCGYVGFLREQCLVLVLPLGQLEQAAAQPHTSEISAPHHPPGLSQLDLRWDQPGASYSNPLDPTGTDVTDYTMLQLRAGVNFDASPLGADQDFTVKLTDGNGDSAEVPASHCSDSLFFPPGEEASSPPSNSPLAPRLLLNTVHIPLAAFTGIDLSDLRSVDFVFDQTPEGAIFVSDIAFASLPGVQDSDGDCVIDTEDLPCDNGFDDDSDGLTDLDDPGCFSIAWHREDPQCDNGADDDGEGGIDDADPGCGNVRWRDNESPACQDGFDNDSDGFTDYPDDPECGGSSGSSEGGACGLLGLEVLPILGWVAARRQRRRDHSNLPSARGDD